VMSGVPCPSCNSTMTVVKDSRPHDRTIRRKRECSRCGTRFNTHETSEADTPSRDAIQALRAMALRIVAHADETLRDE